VNVKDEIEQLIRESLQSAIRDGKLPDAELPFVKVEYPKDERFGDYATPIAMESARVLRKSPLEIGAILQEYVGKAPLVERVEVVKPGFINLFVSFDSLANNLSRVLAEGDGYGRTTRATPFRVNIEFVSANPTGPLNIVSARAAALGDSIANLYEATGATVDREFYVNDYGNQVTLLGRSVLCRYRELAGEAVAFPEDGYHGEYVKDIARHVREQHAAEVESLPDDETRIAYMAEKAVAYNVAGQREDLARFNVRFARWFSEKTLHESGAVERTSELLGARGVLREEEGKKLFVATAYGDEKDRVVVRDDGRPTYLLADIAYHRDKLERGYDRIIDVWGPDHHGYIARLAGAMTALGAPAGRFSILIAQQVNLIMEGEIVKMSKRLGQFSTMRELIDEIGVDVARYFFVMRSLESHLDFDLALAKRESSENPVFYLQYAHARICSIFREAEKRGVAYTPGAVDREPLQNREAVALLKLIARFPEEIVDAATQCEPHRIANYLLRFAQQYHRFYTEHRVISDDPVTTNTYLALCDAVRIVMRNGLRLLGVTAPERM